VKAHASKIAQSIISKTVVGGIMAKACTHI